jgi:hypothetical protein
VIARLKLKPGQKGTKALVEKYGDDLVCVRYRYDEKSRTRIKTVELIVDRKELSPIQENIGDQTLVPVQIAFNETALKEMAKKMGGRWDPEVRLWYIQHDKIKGTDLEKHIIFDASMKIKPSQSI